MSYSDQHYGLGDPDCPICGGVGYVRYDVPEEHPYFGKAFDCECRRARVEAERQAHLRRLGGLENLADKTFDTFNPEGVGLAQPHRDNLRRAFERAAAYAEDPQGWLVIVGGYGCGKTHLAAAIANAQIGKGNKVVFVPVPDLLDYLRAAFGPGTAEEEGYQERFEEIRNAPLLILDDLGIENRTAWTMEKLYQLLNHRYNAHLPTVITTNHNLEELDLRLRSRLSDPDLSQVLPITAPDYRRAGVAAAQSDLNGLGLYAHMTFDSFDLRRDLPRAERDNLKHALGVSKAFADRPEGWLVLMGDYGCGKTHLAAAIANANAARGVAVLFVTVPDLLDHLRATFAPNSTTPYDKRFSEVKTAPLLILDDLGTESATPWAQEKLYQLFNHRYNARLPTVITTAHVLEKLEEIAPRLAVRIRDKRLSKVVAIVAPAYRGEPQGQRG
jgi:DNA replication protein DnaC